MDMSDTDLTSAAAPDGGERIAKRLARAGLCSRRDAERWITEGRVAVNSQTLTSPACVVRPGDIVQVDGKVIPEPEPARLWRYYKPAGLVTSARDEKGRATVFDRLPPELPRVVSIGRLDLTTEGLLLLTNDGELARFLELPATGWTRRYRVRVFGEVDEVRLAALAKGPTIDGVKYGPIEAVLDRIQGRNAWLSVSLKEGKNREIRKVMEGLGLTVNRLIRIAYGPFQLGKLEEGAVEEVPKRVVREQIANFFDNGNAESEPESNTKLRAKARAAAASGQQPEAKAETAPKSTTRLTLKSSPRMDAAALAKRAPRSAAKRLEEQAAWGKDKDDTKPTRGRAEGKPAFNRSGDGKPPTERPARGKHAEAAAGERPSRGRGEGKPTFDRGGDSVAPSGKPTRGKPPAAFAGEKPARGRGAASPGDPSASKPSRGGRPEGRDAPRDSNRDSSRDSPRDSQGPKPRGAKPAGSSKPGGPPKSAAHGKSADFTRSARPAKGAAPMKAAAPKPAAPKPAGAAAPDGPKKRDGRLDRQRVERPRKERPKDGPGADRRR